MLGDNAAGQLGNGTYTSSSVPVSVSNITNATAVTSGYDHTCVLLSSGSVQCWEYNADGEFGNGTSGNLGSIPVAVSGIINAIVVAAGYYYACAVLSDGTVQCWGSNVAGQLGNGTQATTGCQCSPTPVQVSGISSAITAAAGSEHTCTVLSGGSVQCWGWNQYGQLGNGNTNYSSVPVPVSGITNATAVAAGYVHTCALLSGGSVQCWGYNHDGELGNGNTNYSSVPAPVSGISNAVAIDAAEYHTCALLNGGTIQCWGYNVDGELGNGNTMNSLVPVTVMGF